MQAVAHGVQGAVEGVVQGTVQAVTTPFTSARDAANAGEGVGGKVMGGVTGFATGIVDGVVKGANTVVDKSSAGVHHGVEAGRSGARTHVANLTAPGVELEEVYGETGPDACLVGKAAKGVTNVAEDVVEGTKEAIKAPFAGNNNG